MNRPGGMNNRWAAAGTLCCCLLAGGGEAGVTLDGSLGTAGPMAGPTYLIPASVGSRLGGNLFHSFDSFSIGKGESATFTGPAAVTNIISRVTGGAASNIDGALRSEIPGANLFLINPAGVILGPDASLDIDGSFHASTADYLGLGKTGRFDASTPADSVLSSAPPSAFGFLGAKPAPISVNGSFLMVPPGQAISLIGGDITMRNDALLLAPGGHIQAAALASPGIVEPGATQADLAPRQVDAMGDLRLLDSTLDASGKAAGTVIIRAGRCALRDGSGIYSALSEPMGGGDTTSGGPRIDIEATTLTLDDFSIISSRIDAKVLQTAPAIRIRTGRLDIGNDAKVWVSTSEGSSGLTGGIRIQADTIDVHDGGWVRSLAGGASIGGIHVEADAIDIHHYGEIGSDAIGAGDSGAITVSARDLEVRDGGGLVTRALGGSGNAGNLVLSAQEITLSDATSSLLTEIGSYTGTAHGKAGDVQITAERVNLSSGTRISSVSRGPHNAGDIQISAKELSLTDSAAIQTSAYWDGDAGGISVSSDAINLERVASIRSESYGQGHGGAIRLSGDTVKVMDNAYLSTNAYGHGNGGVIVLDADDVVFETGGRALAWAAAAGSVGGDIEIKTRSLAIAGFATAPSPYVWDFTGLDTSAFDGWGGSIRITATEKVSLVSRAALVSSSQGAGQAGRIEIETPTLELRSGAQIASQNIGAGAGGNIRIVADDILLEGVHPQPYDSILGGSMLSASGVAAQTQGLAPAGQVDIRAGRLRILDGARISAETFGAADGGNVTIVADEVLVGGRNDVHHAFLLDQGKSTQTADEMSRSQINAGSRTLLVASPSGDGGDVAISADRLVVTDRGLILSNSAGTGSGGGITLDAREIRLADDGMITARGAGAGPAGSLRITAGERFSNTGGLVSTESESAGGGGITFRVGKVFHLADGAVTTSVRGGGGDAGNIDIDPRFVALNNGHIAANAHGGAGGNIRIVSNYFLTSGASVVEASSALGVDGSVRIESVETQVTDGLEGPRAEYLDASALLRPRCAARAPGQASTFTVSGRGGPPPDPDRPAWSTYSGVIDPADKPDAEREEMLGLDRHHRHARGTVTACR